jgi:iron complex outermembrane receptor protein
LLFRKKLWGKWFYASPAAIDQYEETAGLVGFQRLSKGNFTWKPKVYWRRNQDEYVFIRRIRLFTGICIFQTNCCRIKWIVYIKYGVTGFGIETAKVFLSSNNLGDNNRFLSTLF